MCRRKTVRMSSVWKGFQSVVEPYHSQSQAHRSQAVHMRQVFEDVPATRRPATSCRYPASIIDLPDRPSELQQQGPITGIDTLTTTPQAHDNSNGQRRSVFTFMQCNDESLFTACT